MIYVLDTDIFTLAHMGRHGLREKIAGVTPPDSVAVGMMTRVESLMGRLESVRKAATGAELLVAQDRLARTESFLSEFPILAFDQVGADVFDRLRVTKALRRMDRGDLLIACVAIAHGATLVTRNMKDIAHVPGLRTENWAD